MNGPDTCERILDEVGGAAEATVHVVSSRRGLTRFARSFIHQNVGEDAVTVTLSLAVEGRVATASTSTTDDGGIARLVAGCREASRLRPPDPFWPGLPRPAEVPAVEHWEDATADANPSVRASMVRAVVDAAGGLDVAGFCATTGSAFTLANSAGLRLSGRFSKAELKAVARSDGGDGVASQISTSVADLDGAAVGLDAAKTAKMAGEPIDLPVGSYEVVLAPSCVASVLDFLAYLGFNGKMHAEGRSFAVLGEDQFDSSISIWDDATDARATGLLFDPEGTPKSRLDLVRNGRTTGLAYDRRTAARQGVEPTGHAAGDESTGALPCNLFLAAGGDPPARLVESVSRGLLVSDLWYLRPLDPKSLVVTGLTRNGLFLIEDGHVTRAVRNLRFTQSFVTALAPGNVRGSANDGRLVSGDLSSMLGFAHHVPTLHIGAWHFTGSAPG